MVILTLIAALSFGNGDLADKKKDLDSARKAAIGITELRTVMSGYITLADEARAQDNYDLATDCCRAAMPVARVLKDAGRLKALTATTKRLSEEARAYKRIKKDILALSVDPNDPDASLTTGRFYTFVKGDFKTGIPLLAKGSNAFLKAIAEKELAAGPQPSDALDVGHSWWDGRTAVAKKGALTGAAAATPVKASRRDLRYAQAFRERAAHWYAKAWSRLAPGEKGLLRERFAQVYRTPNPPPPKENPSWIGWYTPARNSYAEQTADYAHSGSWAVALRTRNGPHCALDIIPDLPATPGAECDVTVWVLTDGTSGNSGGMGVPVFNQFGTGVSTAQNNILLTNQSSFEPDCPYWKKKTIKFTFPPNSVSFRVWFHLLAPDKGTLWIDDVSIKVDGREMCVNPSFEDLK